MPNYQRFQGYPDVVGNFNAGQDRGRQMATDDFNTRQTLETQNALLQRSNAAGAGAQSYPDLQAMQMQAKQMSDIYLPALQNAVENRNYVMRDEIVAAMRKTGNPILGKFADVAATATKLDDRQYSMTGTIPDEAAAKKLIDANPQVRAGLGGAELTPGKYDFVYTGMPGTPGATLTKIVTSIHGQPKGNPIAVVDEKGLEAYREQVPEEVFQQMTDHVKSANGRPVYFAVDGLGVPTGDVTKFGPIPGGKTPHDTISTPGDLSYWKDKASPAVFGKLLAFAKENIGKPFSIELDQAGKPTGNVLNLQRPPGVGGFGSAWKLTPEELAAITRAIDEKRLNPNKVNSRTAKVYAGMELEKPGMSFSGKAADIEADSKSLGNQQKIRDMMASFVLNMNAQIDRMDEIKKDLSRTDVRLLNIPIRQLGMRVKGSAIESKVSMYLTEISNEIGKLSTGSAASVAELSLGAQQKWDKIHDPNLSIRDLMSLLRETQHAGNLRMKSVDDTISKTKVRLEGVPKPDTEKYQTPPAGYKATGKKNAEGAPLYITPSGKIVAAPKVQ